MSRNRRNKRGAKVSNNLINITDLSNKNFFITIAIFIVIILLCALIIGIKNYNTKLEIAKQKEILDTQIEAIFEQKQEIEEKDNDIVETKQDTIVNIAVTGDILYSDEMIEDAKQNEKYNFSHMFDSITSIIKNSDIAIGTMETNFVDEKFSDYIKCNSPKEFALSVKNSGISLVSMAHNHALDYGYDGLKTTKTYLESLGYSTVGARTKQEEKRYLVKEIKGIKIAFLAYTYGLNSQNTKNEEELKYVNIFNKDEAIEDIKKAKEEADYIFVIMHWGKVNSMSITNEQEEIGKFLIENGVDSIVGSHPAVIEPMEVIEQDGKNKFIAYSVGNYVSYLGYEYSSLEMILNIQIRKDGKTGETSLDKVTYTPVYMLDNGAKAENRFTLVDIKKVAKQYLYEESQIITKRQYDLLIKGLEKLESIIRSKN